MRRIGFEMGDRGKTVFQYKCEKCGYTRVKMLKDAR